MSDLAYERIDYTRGQLLESEAPADPYRLFDLWLVAAFEAKEQGVLPEPTAMVLATCADGQPSARTVLLKGVDRQGFVFYTNYLSRKGRELTANPRAALHFGWYSQQRQVRIEGTVREVSRAESEAYFASRPRGSQLGAWASEQSEEVPSAAALAEAYAEQERRFAGGEVPCPDSWGGYRLEPAMIEFWQGRPSRMHDRLQYLRREGGWTLRRLAP